MDFVSVLHGILGLGVLLGIALLFSNNRRRINWRTVVGGLLLQIVLAIFVLRGREMGRAFAPLGWIELGFDALSAFFVKILDFTTQGASFVFGSLGLPPGQTDSLGIFFAFQVLPTIIFFSALVSILYYVGLMQLIVKGIAWVVSRTLGTSGAETLSVTADIFIGQTEAPLLIRPFLPRVTHSELMAIMTGGMATVAGGVMAAYISLLGTAMAQAQGVTVDAAQLTFARHLLASSVMSAPAALLLAKIIVPETEESETGGRLRISLEKPGVNVIDAAAIGAADGLKLALNVGAMLIAFIALVAMANWILGQVTGIFGLELTLEQVFGWILAPLAWLIGVPWADAVSFGGLLGTKVVLNEFVAYLGLADAIGAASLSPKAIVMATFALCGFANFSSIAIQIGGIGPLAPERTPDLARLGMRAVLAGTLANLMTATIAGVLIG
jgi:CNT family concentrative nucleoside transporter